MRARRYIVAAYCMAPGSRTMRHSAWPVMATSAAEAEAEACRTDGRSYNLFRARLDQR